MFSFDVDVWSGNIGDLKINIIGFLVDLFFFFRKKFCGNCFLCIGNVDKDEFYRRVEGRI